MGMRSYEIQKKTEFIFDRCEEAGNSVTAISRLFGLYIPTLNY